MRYSRILLIATAALLPLLASAADLAALIRDGDSKGALAAIRNGADVNAAQPDGTTPLMWAVVRSDLEAARELLSRGAKPGGRNALGATVLSEAIGANNKELIDLLLKAGADPNLGNDDDETPLMLAARSGSLPIVEALVKAGAKVDTREKFRGQSALMWAVGTNTAGAGAVTDFLIKQGAEVDFRSAVNDWGNQMTGEPRAQYRATGGLTPLLYATRSGCLDCIKSLLKAGAKLELPTPEGVSPLMNAIDNGQYAVANYLLDQGANPHLFDWWGRTALYIAIDMHSRGGSIGGVGAGGGGRGGGRGAGGPGGPLGAGGPGAPGGAGRSGGPGPGAAVAGVAAAAAGPQPSAIQVAQRLLEMGVDPNTQLEAHRPFLGRFVDDLLNTGCTPLLRAAVGFDREAVELLLKHGAIVDLPNVMGVTPLMAAAGIGHGGVGGSGPGQSPTIKARPGLENDGIAIVELLLKSGADINARTTDTSSHTGAIARPNSMSMREGQTAIFGAVGAGTVNETVNPRSWLKLTQFLIDHGAKLDIKDARGVDLIECMKGLDQGQQIARCGGRDSPSTPEMVKLVRTAMGLPPETPVQVSEATSSAPAKQ
ncbi:MAG: ankyrin repeat domain-containing protein [Pseudomonadota bacterium]